MVTFEEFQQFISERPEWFYGKLCLIYQQFEEGIDSRDIQIAQEELDSKAKDGEIALLHCELREVKGQLQD